MHTDKTRACEKCKVSTDPIDWSHINGPDETDTHYDCYMAMEFRKIVVNDLFLKNKVLNVQSPEALATHYARPRLGAATFLTVDTKMDRDLAAIHQCCVDGAVATIWPTGWNSYLFLAGLKNCLGRTS
jgi:hypothetical protein